jgi:hypothetical protein
MSSLQPVGGLEEIPPNRSIIGPAFDVDLEESESDERSSNGETGALLLVFEDKMSTADELLWAGDPIDKRSKRTSVPLLDA